MKTTNHMVIWSTTLVLLSLCLEQITYSFELANEIDIQEFASKPIKHKNSNWS